MKRQFGAVVPLIGCLLLSSCSSGDSQYLPSVGDGDGYRFSEAQLEHMAKTPLKRDLFVRYIQAKWPLEKIKTFCTPENRFPDVQNLVGQNEWGKIPLYEGQHDFDRIFVYVSEDDGKSIYHPATLFRRWEYSLNIIRGKEQWTAIETLPNDLVDESSKISASGKLLASRSFEFCVSSPLSAQLNSPLALHEFQARPRKPARPSAHFSILGFLAAGVQSFVGSGIIPTRPRSSRSASQQTWIVMSASFDPSVWAAQAS